MTTLSLVYISLCRQLESNQLYSNLSLQGCPCWTCTDEKGKITMCKGLVIFIYKTAPFTYFIRYVYCLTLLYGLSHVDYALFIIKTKKSEKIFALTSFCHTFYQFVYLRLTEQFLAFLLSQIRSFHQLAYLLSTYLFHPLTYS